MKLRSNASPATAKLLQKYQDCDRAHNVPELIGSGASLALVGALLGIGAINVARARFGLKPRRNVSGRPKQEPDEPAHKIERVAFITSRRISHALSPIRYRSDPNSCASVTPRNVSSVQLRHSAAFGCSPPPCCGMAR